jgi:hypothetical protein
MTEEVKEYVQGVESLSANYKTAVHFRSGAALLPRLLSLGLTVNSDDHGKFRFELPPGTYEIVPLTKDSSKALIRSQYLRR